MEDKMSDIFICLKYTLVYAIKKKKRKGNSKKLSSARQTTANNKLLKSIPSAAFSDQAQVNVAI